MPAAKKNPPTKIVTAAAEQNEDRKFRITIADSLPSLIAAEILKKNTDLGVQVVQTYPKSSPETSSPKLTLGQICEVLEIYSTYSESKADAALRPFQIYIAVKFELTLTGDDLYRLMKKVPSKAVALIRSSGAELSFKEAARLFGSSATSAPKAGPEKLANLPEHTPNQAPVEPVAAKTPGRPNRVVYAPRYRGTDKDGNQFTLHTHHLRLLRQLYESHTLLTFNEAKSGAEKLKMPFFGKSRAQESQINYQTAYDLVEYGLAENEAGFYVTRGDERTAAGEVLNAVVQQGAELQSGGTARKMAQLVT